jgi:hypothetical protein
MSQQPTQTSIYRREKQTTQEQGSATSRAYCAEIEVGADDRPVIFPEIAIAFCDL